MEKTWLRSPQKPPRAAAISPRAAPPSPRAAPPSPRSAPLSPRAVPPSRPRSTPPSPRAAAPLRDDGLRSGSSTKIPWPAPEPSIAARLRDESERQYPDASVSSTLARQALETQWLRAACERLQNELAYERWRNSVREQGDRQRTARWAASVDAEAHALISVLRNELLENDAGMDVWERRRRVEILQLEAKAAEGRAALEDQAYRLGLALQESHEREAAQARQERQPSASANRSWWVGCQ